MSSRPCCRAFGTVRPLHPVSCTRVCARTPLPHSREDASAAWTLCQPSRSGAHRGCAFGSLCLTWCPAGRRDMHTRVCARQARPVPPEKLPREGVWQMLSQRGRRSDGQAWAAHTFRGRGGDRDADTWGDVQSRAPPAGRPAVWELPCARTPLSPTFASEHSGLPSWGAMAGRGWPQAWSSGRGGPPPGGRPLPAGATRLSALCRPGTPCPGCGRWAAPHRAFFPGCRKDHTVWPARKCPTPASVRGDVKAEASRARERRHWRASKNFPVSCDAEIR